MNSKFKKILVIIVLGSFLSCTTGPLKLKRHRRFSEGIFSFTSSSLISGSTLVVDGNEMIFGTDGQSLVCYDILKKSIKWKFKSGSSIDSTPLVYKEFIFAGNSEGKLFALKKDSGKMIWEYSSQGEIISRPEVNPDGIVYFTSAEGVLTALDLKTGEWLWHYKKGANQKVTVRGVSSPVLIDKDMLIVGFSDGFLNAFNPNDGSVIWEKKIADKGRFLDVDALPVYRSGRIYIPTFGDGLYCLDKNGDRIWKFEKGGATSRILLDGKYLYFASNSGEIFKIDAKSAKIVWQNKFEKSAPTNPILMGNNVVFGTYEGDIFLFDISNGEKLWRYRLSGEIRGNIVSNSGDLYVMTSKGHFFILGK